MFFCVDGASPLSLLPESASRYWLRMGSRRTDQEDHIRLGDEKEERTIDKAS
jgi:hypothetical protein